MATCFNLVPCKGLVESSPSLIPPQDVQPMVHSVCTLREH